MSGIICNAGNICEPYNHNEGLLFLPFYKALLCYAGIRGNIDADNSNGMVS